MTRILVDPHQLRSLSVQLQRVSGDLQAVEGQLAGALGGLTWEARQKANLDTRASHARGQARELATEVEKMSRYLERKAQVFDEADGRGVPSVLQLSRARIDAMRATAPWLRFPSRGVNALASLGAVLGGSSLVGALHLPALTGITVSLAALTALSAGFVEQAQDFLESIWDWLRSNTKHTEDTDVQARQQQPGIDEANDQTPASSEQRISSKQELEDRIEKERGRLPDPHDSEKNWEEQEQCVAWARRRREDFDGSVLPRISPYNDDMGAYNLIEIFNAEKISENDKTTTKPGSLIVWDKTAGNRHGHVAVLEGLAEDGTGIWVSHANHDEAVALYTWEQAEELGLCVIPLDADPVSPEGFNT